GRASQAPAAAPLLLAIEALRCWHPLPAPPWRPRWLKAVDGVSLELHRGETIGLVGASGCGKSTLCRALMGLAPVRGGAVRLEGVDLQLLGGRWPRPISGGHERRGAGRGCWRDRSARHDRAG
ncbi:MAG: ATP-binding cassette domain-containing protein, partial [Cyanobium sp.]